MNPPDPGITRAGAELMFARDADERWLRPDDVTGPLVVFIHGFTAHGRYLTKLARYVDSGACVTALFNYDSYLGIERAASDLEFLLDGLDDRLTQHGLVLVGHSMGGLVARQFAECSAAPCRHALKGIATLGTPHRGVLSQRVLNHMLDWADTVSMPNPFARSIACVASRQLTDPTASGVIAALNARAGTSRVPILSVSGGMPYLELGWGDRGLLGLFGALQNAVLQRLIAERPNDGLVAESSSDITQILGAGHRSHRSDYPAYQRINHTYVSQNQQIGQLLHRWIRDVVPGASAASAGIQAGSVAQGSTNTTRHRLL